MFIYIQGYGAISPWQFIFAFPPGMNTDNDGCLILPCHENHRQYRIIRILYANEMGCYLTCGKH